MAGEPGGQRLEGVDAREARHLVTPVPALPQAVRPALSRSPLNALGSAAQAGVDAAAVVRRLLQLQRVGPGSRGVPQGSRAPTTSGRDLVCR